MWIRLNTLNATELATRPSILLLTAVVLGIFVQQCVHWYRKSRYLFAAPSDISQAYHEARGNPFVIETPTNRHVMISSPHLISELYAARTSELSLHALAQEWLQPRYTMQGFEWKERRGDEKIGYVKVLSNTLPQNLPSLLTKIARSIDIKLSRLDNKDGAQVSLFPLLKRIVAESNCIMYFGEEFAADESFVDAALKFPEDVVMIAEAIRLVPQSLRGSFVSLIRRFKDSQDRLLKALEPEVERRLKKRHEELGSGCTAQNRENDCMQWLIDASPTSDPWTTTRMLGEIMAIWFGSVHQLSMTAYFAICDLADHPEYYEPLRREALAARTAVSLNLDDDLVLLDSFLRESARYSYGDAVSTRRKALQDFTFSDGTRVFAGDWVCVPQGPMLNDETLFADADSFRGFRFVPSGKVAHTSKHFEKSQDGSENPTEPTSFTSLNDQALLWGTGKTACPGRFYASALLKTIMISVLTAFECPRITSSASRSFSWRSTRIPRSSFTVHLKPIRDMSS